MECVSTVSYSFLINGGPQGKVTPTRGLRQDDPFLQYLFIFRMDVLYGLCRKAQENGSLLGVRVARNSPQINHLQFTDDTMFFCRSDSASCSALSIILSQYEAVSGQSINMAKLLVTLCSKTT